MASALESIKPISTAVDQNSSARISFSAEFLDDKNFISITPSSPAPAREEKRERHRETEFEFLSNKASSHSMLSADELFFEGKLLPFWGLEHAEKLNKITLNGKAADGKEEAETEKDQKRGNWFIDDDPSPRPPKCTVLWKELLRLKKQRASSLSPSSSTSSSSSSSSVSDSTTPGHGKEWSKNKEKQVKRIKKGLERTRSASIRVRPMVNVPICTHVKSSGLPPLLSLKKVRTERSENGRSMERLSWDQPNQSSVFCCSEQSSMKGKADGEVLSRPEAAEGPDQSSFISKFLALLSRLFLIQEDEHLISGGKIREKSLELTIEIW